MKTVLEICKRDQRYPPRGYVFVLEALDYTAKKLNKTQAEGAERHVTGTELLEGIRTYAVEQFGPMALTVLKSWGLKRTEDFGNIVFNLVDAGKLRKTDRDSRDHFAGGYDFHDAFAKPYLPGDGARRVAARKRRPRKVRGDTERKGERDD